MRIIMSSWCHCSCHSVARANYEGAIQIGEWNKAMEIALKTPYLNAVGSVDASDPVEAAVAQGCSCIDFHTCALGDEC